MVLPFPAPRSHPQTQIGATFLLLTPAVLQPRGESEQPCDPAKTQPAQKGFCLDQSPRIPAHERGWRTRAHNQSVNHKVPFVEVHLPCGGAISTGLLLQVRKPHLKNSPSYPVLWDWCQQLPGTSSLHFRRISPPVTPINCYPWYLNESIIYKQINKEIILTIMGLNSYCNSMAPSVPKNPFPSAHK